MRGPTSQTARAGKPQVVGQIVKVLIVDRVDHRRIQHIACDPRNPIVESTAVPPAGNRLKFLRAINHHIRAIHAAANENCRDEENVVFKMLTNGKIIA